MELHVTPSAVDHFKQEWGFQNGDYVRLFVRIGGCSSVQESYSIGISKEPPSDLMLKDDSQGITFFMERTDVWYLEDKDFTVDFEPECNEVIFKS